MFPYVEHAQGSGGQAGPGAGREGRGSRRRHGAGRLAAGAWRGSFRGQEELLSVAGRGGPGGRQPLPQPCEMWAKAQPAAPGKQGCVRSGRWRECREARGRKVVRAQPADPRRGGSGGGRPRGGVTAWPRGLAAVGWVDQPRLSSEAEPGCVYIKRLIVRNWLLRLGAGKPEIHQAGQQPGRWGSGVPGSSFPPNLSLARQARAGRRRPTAAAQGSGLH